MMMRGSVAIPPSTSTWMLTIWIILDTIVSNYTLWRNDSTFTDSGSSRSARSSGTGGSRQNETSTIASPRF